MKNILQWFVFAFCFVTVEASAQYFGRNKPKYEKFDFEVTQTRHFNIYHYFNNDHVAQNLATQAESWYYLHQRILKDTLRPYNPILLYRNHADFQQTNAISSAPGIGTGGVTEALKNRVIMPVTESNAQTDHVLGHELVHAFQYTMILHSKDSSLSRRSLTNIPLWMVEGLAEYMSLGSKDPHTAMWMRDAVINNDIPTIEDLSTSNEYFPYRYGHAFWAFIANVWGDDIIKTLFIETARRGYKGGIQEVFNFGPETLSALWSQSLKKYYGKFEKQNSGPLIGKRILSEENAGRINISPEVSPNGNYVAFFSEKDLFTIDLFLADVRSGEIIKKLTTTSQASHIDAISFLESSGAWAPNSRQFAYIVVDNGQNKIVITDVATRRIVNELVVPGVPAINNLTWSPDGKKLAFTGLVDGQSDLYTYNLKTGEVEQLTNDYFSDLQPSWFGNDSLLFITDRIPDKTVRTYGKNGIALINTRTKQIKKLKIFPGADNYDPVSSPDGNSIYFVSDRDGFRNLYRYDLTEKNVYQLTNYFTGISGITPAAPVLSIAREKNLLAYIYYNKGTYDIFSAPLTNFIEKEVDPLAVDMSAAYLPPHDPEKQLTLVENNIVKRFMVRDTLHLDPEVIPYKPKFKLDYIGSTGVGVTTSRFGTGMAGGVNGIFSDILGNRQLFASLSLNGEVYDFGGQVVYLNRKNRLQWGVGASHIPYRYGWYDVQPDTLVISDDTLNVTNVGLNIMRTFENRLSAYLVYPISTTKRLEFEGSHAWYSNRRDRLNNYYYRGLRIDITRDRDLPAPEGYTLQRLSGALVSDNSYFGLAAPLKGHRYRLQAEQYFGRIKTFTTLVDYRKYFYINPFTLAFRGYHFARYGSDIHNGLIPPFFLGAPGVIRGYSTGSFYDPGNSLNINNLLGSRVVVGNVEIRLPFTGPRELALFQSNILFTDVNLFLDGGMAWGAENIATSGEQKLETGWKNPVFSTGVSVRVNVFGAIIVEPYYAVPLSRDKFKGEFGINFIPGW